MQMDFCDIPAALVLRYLVYQQKDRNKKKSNNQNGFELRRGQQWETAGRSMKNSALLQQPQALLPQLSRCSSKTNVPAEIYKCMHCEIKYSTSIYYDF